MKVYHLNSTQKLTSPIRAGMEGTVNCWTSLANAKANVGGPFGDYIHEGNIDGTILDLTNPEEGIAFIKKINNLLDALDLDNTPLEEGESEDEGVQKIVSEELSKPDAILLAETKKFADEVRAQGYVGYFIKAGNYKTFVCVSPEKISWDELQEKQASANLKETDFPIGTKVKVDNKEGIVVPQGDENIRMKGPRIFVDFGDGVAKPIMLTRDIKKASTATQPEKSTPNSILIKSETSEKSIPYSNLQFALEAFRRDSKFISKMDKPISIFVYGEDGSLMAEYTNITKDNLDKTLDTAIKKAADYGEEFPVYEDNAYKLFWLYTGLGYYYYLLNKTTNHTTLIPVHSANPGKFRIFGLDSEDDKNLIIDADKIKWGDIPEKDRPNLVKIIKEKGTSTIKNASAHIKVAFKSVEKFLEEHPSGPTEKELKDEYAKYLGSYNQEMARLSAKNLLGKEGYPALSFEDWKALYVEKPLNFPKTEAEYKAYYLKYPAMAHEYVYNAIHSGKKMEDLDQDIVEAARQYEEQEIAPNKIAEYNEDVGPYCPHMIADALEASDGDIDKAISYIENQFPGEVIDKAKLVKIFNEEARKAKAEMEAQDKFYGKSASINSDDKVLEKIKSLLFDASNSLSNFYGDVADCNKYDYNSAMLSLWEAQTYLEFITTKHYEENVDSQPKSAAITPNICVGDQVMYTDMFGKSKPYVIKELPGDGTAFVVGEGDRVVLLPLNKLRKIA